MIDALFMQSILDVAFTNVNYDGICCRVLRYPRVR